MIYEKPNIEVTYFRPEDVVITSGLDNGGAGETPDNWV